MGFRFVLVYEVGDKVRWIMTEKNGVFTVKSMFKAVQPSLNEPFRWQIVWGSCVQPKISFFIWEVV